MSGAATEKKKATQTYVCSVCHAEKEGRMLPRGWKRPEAGSETIYCTKCWRRMYVLRSVVIPVAGPVDMEWKDLYETMRECFRQATQLSNWTWLQCARADVVRDASMEKLPPAPNPYLYPGARALVPQMPSNSVVAIISNVQRKYNSLRYEMIWTCQRSAPSFRYPQPFPVRSRDWRVELTEEGELLVSVPVIGGERVQMRLQQGPGFRRQCALLKRMLAGEGVIKSEMSIYLGRAGSRNVNRQAVPERDTGGRKVYKRLVCKFCLWVPKPQDAFKQKTGTMSVVSGVDCLLAAYDEKQEKIRWWNVDYIRRAIEEHHRRMRRLSDDQKAEERRPGPARFQSLRERWSRKHAQRMATVCHMVAAQVVGVARRRHYAEIVYDDTEKRYCPSFAWHQLRQLIAEKADYYGIAFRHEKLDWAHEEENGSEEVQA